MLIFVIDAAEQRSGGKMAQRKAAPLAGVVMGSDSDWDIMKHAVAQLDAFGIANEPRVLSAHRMPDDMFEYAEDAGTARAARDHRGRRRRGAPARHARRQDDRARCSACRCRRSTCAARIRCYSIVQMPKGIPVATFAIGEAGAANAGLFAAAIIAGTDPVGRAQARRVSREADRDGARAMRVPPA